MLSYTVMAAGTPAQAPTLARTNSGPIHLLLTDVVMPAMNGLDLAEAIGKLRQDIKSLFMPGCTANVIAYHGVLDEDVRFLQKPYPILESISMSR